MPYSFIQIERRETRVIYYLWLALFFIYCLLFSLILLGLDNIIQNVLHFIEGGLQFYFFSPSDLFWIAGFGTVFTLLTYHFATADTLGRMRRVFRARNLNDSLKEKALANIIEELGVASGFKAQIQGAVLPFSSLNILAVADHEGRAIIAVTQGALEKLSRSQLEAAMAHEMAYIVSGDAFINTTASLAFTVYSAMFEGAVGFIPGLFSSFSDSSLAVDDLRFRPLIGQGQYHSGDDLGGAPATGVLPLPPQLMGIVVLSYLFSIAAFFLSSIITKILAMFISRAMVLKSDAIGVRITRDPRSLAEAIYILAYHARGSEMPVGRYFHPIFFVHPSPSAFDMADDLLGDIFGTHPTAEARIRILMDMAHGDIQELKGLVPDLSQVVPLYEMPRTPPSGESRWEVLEQGLWRGPYDLAQIHALPFFHAGMFVRRDTEDLPRKAGFVDEFLGIFKASDTGRGSPLLCPSCQGALKIMPYEGGEVEICSSCYGVLSDKPGVLRILDRNEVVFSQEIKDKACALSRQSAGSNEWRAKTSVSSLVCPICRQEGKMIRSAYSFDYPVEIDHCKFCDRMWFDRDEIEILQFLYESRLR